MPHQVINWDRLRARWIERHLAGETYTLKQLARDESVKYDTLKKRAHREDWRGQLSEGQARIDAQVGIGVGKSTIGLYAHAYMLYELLCQKNPHGVYGLDPASEIVVVFQGPTKEMAKDVDFERFREMLDRAPIFSDVHFKYKREVKSRLEFPKRIVVKPIAGLDTSALDQRQLLLPVVVVAARGETTTRIAGPS